MDDSKDDDLVGTRVEVNRVGKVPQERTARLVLGTRVRERCLDDSVKRMVDLRREGSAKPRALVLVPVMGVE